MSSSIFLFLKSKTIKCIFIILDKFRI
jgi:hypothetical protein